jgi:hypothetical protein
VDVLNPHGKDFVGPHATVLQNYHNQPCLLPEPLGLTMLDRLRISLFEIVLNLLIEHPVVQDLWLA